MKFRLALAVLFLATGAFAEDAPSVPPPPEKPAPTAPAAPAKFYLEVDQADLNAISQALNELPKRVADPLIIKLNNQLSSDRQNQIRNALEKPQK